MRQVIKYSKKFFILLIGVTAIAVGVLFLVLPGPGLPVIIIGLVVLASEFAWAQSALHKVRHSYEKSKNAIKNGVTSTRKKQ